MGNHVLEFVSYIQQGSHDTYDGNHAQKTISHRSQQQRHVIVIVAIVILCHYQNTNSFMPEQAGHLPHI